VRLRSLTFLLRALCALGVLCGSCATAPRAPDEGGKVWVRADGEHLFVETDRGASLAPTLVREFENARSAMTTALLPNARAPRQPLEVVVIGARELAAMTYEVLGVYSDRLFVGPALIVSDEDRWKRRSVMRHELAHAVIAENLHDVPQWLNEGLAVMLATADLDERSGEVTWGAILTHQAAWTGSASMTTLARLLDLKPWRPGEIGRFELSAGLLVRMLASKHPDEFRCLLQSLSRYQPYAEAMAGCFPERSWGRDYLNAAYEADRDVGKTQIQPYKAAVKVERMTDGDVHAVLALVNLVVAGWNHDEAERAALLDASARHRRRALALDAAQILAASLELETEGNELGNECARAKFAAGLVSENPDDWRAWFWRGNLKCTPYEEVTSARERAWKLAPYRPEVLASRADDTCRKHDWKACEAMARQGQLTGKLELEFGSMLFESLEQQGRCDEARRLLNESDALAKRVEKTLATNQGRLNAGRTIYCVDPPSGAPPPPTSR
jgi:hypothetical protein